jgi:large subunit ribosomal protein L11
MSKAIKTVIKLQIPAGKANPAPPVGPALGQHGLPIQDFCTQFNSATKDKGNTIIPVEITVYEDRTFSFICKTPPAAVLIKEKLKLKKGSGVPQTNKVGKISLELIQEIAEIKMPDLNAKDLRGAMMIIAGTAKRAGVEVPETEEIAEHAAKNDSTASKKAA